MCLKWNKILKFQPAAYVIISESNLLLQTLQHQRLKINQNCVSGKETWQAVGREAILSAKKMHFQRSGATHAVALGHEAHLRVALPGPISLSA